jgi:hypothetical protein
MHNALTDLVYLAMPADVKIAFARRAGWRSLCPYWKR